MNRVPLKATVLFSAAIAAALGGCDKKEAIHGYSAPKDPPVVASSSDAPDESAQAVTLTYPGRMRWSLPDGWKQVPPPPGRGGIRAAAAIQVSPDPQLLITMSVMPASGPEIVEPNIRRWAGMVKLDPTSDLKSHVKHTEQAGTTSDVVDLSSADSSTRILGAIVQNGGQTWAYKLLGPSDAIAAQKDKFDQFSASIKFEESAAAPVAGPAAPSAPNAPSAPADHTASGGAVGVNWTLPADWTAEPASGMRVATIHPGNASTQIIVSKFGGGAGGLAMNVTRWRNQVGLPPVEEPDAGVSMTVGGAPCTLHDYVGPASGGSRLIVASIDVNGTTWFFKLIGPTDAVASQKAAFESFLGTLKFQ